MARILLALLVAAAALAPLSAGAVEKLVTVSGEATVAVPPDAVIIRIGLSSLGKTAREASDSNSHKMTTVLASMKESGIADRDVQTSRLSLQPQYDTSKPGPARLQGFQVTNQVTVRIRDIDKLPTVLDKAISAGANEMSGIEFIVTEQSKLLDQARDEAIADARRKATLYAQAAGGKLGPVVSIVEEGSTSPPRPPMAALRMAVPVAPGERELRAAVSVSYELVQ